MVVEFLSTNFFIFVAIGFLAQLVDGALGMAYGVISTTALLTFGVQPVMASASVHIAEMFTTGMSGISHSLHKNVDWKLFFKITPVGIIGGVIGAYVLTSIHGNDIKFYIIIYLALMGLLILYRSIRPRKKIHLRNSLTIPLGLGGGFVDAVGGGGWGPVVTSTLIGIGESPRYVIGTVNTSEFFVATATSTSFIIALLTKHWHEENNLLINANAIIGLMLGGLIAAPLAGWVVKIIPVRALGIMVGLLVIGLSLYQLHLGQYTLKQTPHLKS